MRNRIIIFLLFLSFLSCTQNSEKRRLIESAPLISQSFVDDMGRKIVLERGAKRIVSIAPNITEIIFAIGAQDRLIARSQACDYPPDVSKVPIVQTYPQLDMEYLSGLNADLVFATTEIFKEDDIAILEEVNIPVYVQSYKSLEEVYQGIRKMGEILEKDSMAQSLADSLQQLEQKVVSKTESLAKYNTMILISADPLKVVGGEGFLNELIGKAGGKNIFADKDQAYASTTLEEIIYRTPEVIIFPSADSKALQGILSQYPALTRTLAYKNRQVFTLTPDWLYRPGPRMLNGLLELTNILHASLTPDNILNDE